MAGLAGALGLGQGVVDLRSRVFGVAVAVFSFVFAADDREGAGDRVEGVTGGTPPRSWWGTMEFIHGAGRSPELIADKRDLLAVR